MRRVCATLLAGMLLNPGMLGAASPPAPAKSLKTATPIKHVIIIVGENRSFDHLFATYTPKDKDDKVLNLLSEGIVNADGTPGANFAKAHQSRLSKLGFEF